MVYPRPTSTLLREYSGTRDMALTPGVSRRVEPWPAAERYLRVPLRGGRYQRNDRADSDSRLGKVPEHQFEVAETSASSFRPREKTTAFKGPQQFLSVHVLFFFFGSRLQFLDQRLRDVSMASGNRQGPDGRAFNAVSFRF